MRDMEIYVREELQEKELTPAQRWDWWIDLSSFDRNTLTEDVNEGSRDVFFCDPTGRNH